MLNIKIFVPTASSICRLTTDANKLSIERLKTEGKADVHIKVIENNKIPLTSLYNRLKAEAKTDNVDYVMFIHDDVELNLYSLVNHLMSVDGKYDIYGLVGTKRIDTRHCPLTWFTGSRGLEQYRYGKVIHDQYSEAINFFNDHSPDITDTNVITIDGLCMILSKKVIESDIAFDSTLKNDFYDLDFCFSATFNYKYKIGVLVEDNVKHFSVGMSITKKEYLIPESYFRKKWNLSPIGH